MIRYRNSAFLVAAYLAACTPAQDETAPEGADGTPSDEVSAQSVPSGQPAPEGFAATAWRSVAEDGARYTTYLDPEGAYRDFRNGDLWQEGSWSYADAQGSPVLCFTPDDENGVERCWEPGRLENGTLKASGSGGKTIELERMEYQLPQDGSDEDA